MVHNCKHGDKVKYPVKYFWLCLKHCFTNVLDSQAEQWEQNKLTVFHLTCIDWACVMLVFYHLYMEKVKLCPTIGTTTT